MREIARLSSASPPRDRVAAGVEQHIGRAPAPAATRRPVSGHARPAPRVEQRRARPVRPRSCRRGPARSPPAGWSARRASRRQPGRDRPGGRAARSVRPASGGCGSSPASTCGNVGPARYANALPCSCTCSTPRTTTSRSACSVALTTTNAPPDTPSRISATRSGPPSADVGQRDAAHLVAGDPRRRSSRR